MLETWLNKVIQGDVLAVLRGFPSDAVDCVVTSPPYWGLRFYGVDVVSVWDGVPECQHEWVSRTVWHDNLRFRGGNSIVGNDKNPEIHKNPDTKADFCSKCGAWRGQLGLEPHPNDYVRHIVQVMREVKRVLKPSGTLWLNMGDTYYGSSAGNKSWSEGEDGLFKRLGERNTNGGERPVTPKPCDGKSSWLQPKQKMLIPERVAIAMQEDQWILRNDICWHKPNHMPQSVRDRLSNAWEHVYFFVKNRRYFFDLDAIRKPTVTLPHSNKRTPQKSNIPLTHHFDEDSS